MAIEAGRRLGTFEVMSRLGVGGMGEVYLARDSRLGREVAIKVLPEGVARDPERLARFDREARALASLSHPNVGAIHGAEEAEGVRFLVLELIPGDTLGDRIARGALELEEALRLACQIAAAVEAAHERGIVHRDLKPANVKVTPDGRVKVLDFGLARMLAPIGDSGNAIAMAGHETQHGVILGTPTYMSPEQARGESADKRSDVWAFGCLLYEMLSGRKAFKGDTVTDVLAGILHRDPDWHALPAATPRALRKLLGRCLQRDRERRLHDIADARIEMEDVLADLQAGTLEPAGAAPMSRRRALVLAGGGAAAGALMGGAATFWALRPRTAAGQATRFNLAIPAAAPLLDVFSGASALALSPDGRALAFVGRPVLTSLTQLWLRPLDASRPRLLPGTDNATTPFFSTDGKWLGFFANGMVRKVHVDTGEPLGVAQAGRLRGASWAEDGRIVFAGFSTGLMVVDTLGGKPRPLTTLDAGGAHAHRWPEVLPGGQGVLLTIATGEARAVAAVPMSGGTPRVLVEDAMCARYVRGGTIVFARKGTLMAARFDTRKLELTGTPVPVLDDVRMVRAGTGGAHYAVSATGSLVYVPGAVKPSARTLIRVDRQGKIEPLTQDRRAYSEPRLSPDGRRLAVAIEDADGRDDLWAFDLEREMWNRLTSDGTTMGPVWSPDGQQLAFGSERTGTLQAFVMPVDGGAARQITRGTDRVYPVAFSPDGRRLACLQQSDKNVSVVLVAPDGSQAPEPLASGATNEASPAFSPDGLWIAYAAEVDGYRIFVTEARGGGRRWTISTGEGSEPVWSRSGRELFYRQGGQFYVVDIQPGPQFRAGRPRLLFEVPMAMPASSVSNFDVTLDGSRLIMVLSPPETAAELEVVYVPDWAEELREKLRG